jgi:hypothetical protein
MMLYVTRRRYTQLGTSCDSHTRQDIVSLHVNALVSSLLCTPYPVQFQTRNTILSIADDQICP